MASCIGSARSSQTTVRPVFRRSISFAPESTSRCFMIAGSETENGRANSLIESPGSDSSLASSARRVGSDSALKVRSS